MKAHRLAPRGWTAALGWTVPLLSALMLALAGCSDPGGEEGTGGSAGGTGGVGFGANGGGTGGTPGNGLQACETDGECPAATPWCAPSKFCFECYEDSHCSEGTCLEGDCVPSSCDPGEKICSANKVLTCKPAGDGWSSFECIDSTCQGGDCTGCAPGNRVCQGTAVAECSADGSVYSQVEQCPASCLDGLCVTCFEGQKRCQGEVVEACGADGNWSLTEDCASLGKNCLLGTCVSACFNDPKSLSNTGCDYWAVDLDNHYAASDSPYAIVVANLDPDDNPAEVTVSVKDNAADAAYLVQKETVGAGELHIFSLPSRNMGSAGMHYAAYRVESNAPIIAYQFNPLDNVDVFSNDASLLLPANTLGTEYIAVSHFEFLGGGPDPAIPIPYRGSISVVATKADTTVKVTPTARTQAGSNMQTMSPGQEYTYLLQPFQVLNIKSDDAPVGTSGVGGDLTGTVISADKEIAVFSGHEAAVSSSYCCADHLETQLFPVNTWGLTYVGTKAFARWKEKDYWRVVAAEDGTTVQFEPSIEVNQALNRGEYFEFITDKDFKITATKPVMVSQMLASSSETVDPPAYGSCTSSVDCDDAYTCNLDNNFELRCLPPPCFEEGEVCLPGHTCSCLGLGCGCEPTGDPALMLAAPVEQFRESYVFLTPNAYRDDYVNVIAPNDAQNVRIDGVQITEFTTIPGTGYKVARLQVADGVHRLEADQKVGVIAYGYDDDVSYGYTAGLNLNDQSQ